MISNGIDLVEISRIKESLENPRFIERIFSGNEIEIINSNNVAVESIAGAFAAKEAFSKSLGSGVSGFKWNEVEILHDDAGCPYISLFGNAKIIAESKGLSFALSITHTSQYAAAMVTAYTKEQSL